MGKKAEHANKKIPDVSGLVTTTVLNTNIGSLYKKKQIMSQNLVKLKRRNLNMIIIISMSLLKNSIGYLQKIILQV